MLAKRNVSTRCLDRVDVENKASDFTGFRRAVTFASPVRAVVAILNGYGIIYSSLLYS